MVSNEINSLSSASTQVIKYKLAYLNVTKKKLTEFSNAIEMQNASRQLKAKRSEKRKEKTRGAFFCWVVREPSVDDFVVLPFDKVTQLWWSIQNQIVNFSSDSKLF
jgi:hypothetical protein